MYDDEDLNLSDVEYFVQEYMRDINLMSLCRKHDVNFFLHARDMHLDDAKSDIHIIHPTKKEIIAAIKKLSLEEEFINVDLDDAVNAIFLHKIDEVTIKDSLGDLILGMNKDNFMQKLYHYNESYEDEQDVNHYKDPEYGYVVDRIHDTYKILMRYIILNLKSNLATFLEDYYQTKAGVDFVEQANTNAINGNGRLTTEDFHYFVNEINKASLVEQLITKEDNIMIYKLPETDQLGGFFVTVNEGLKFSLNIMEPTDRSGFNSRGFNNVLFAKLIYDGVIKKLNKLANKNNTTIENYWEHHVANNDDNKLSFVNNVLGDNHQCFDDLENYSSHSSRPIHFQLNKKYFYLNQKYINKFSKTLKELNKATIKNQPTQLKIKHVTSLKILKDEKIAADIVDKLNEISSDTTYMRAFLRPCYQKNQDLKRFHENEKEVNYLYNNVIDKRCFNSKIDQNSLNNGDHYNKVMKLIFENFIIGEKKVVQKKIKLLSKQEVYNIGQYLEVFIFRSYREPVKILSKRLKDLNIKVDVKYFVNCIVTNFMESRHEGRTSDINYSLQSLLDTIEHHEKFKIEKSQLSAQLDEYRARRDDLTISIKELMKENKYYIENSKDLTDEAQNLLGELIEVLQFVIRTEATFSKKSL